MMDLWNIINDDDDDERGAPLFHENVLYVQYICYVLNSSDVYNLE